MTDETVHIQPAIPSRAAQQPAAPAFLNQPIAPGTEGYPSVMHRRRAGTRKGMATKRAKKEAKTLPAAEIKKINAKRKKNMKKTKKVAKRKVRTPAQIVRAAPRETGRAKNPNRPLEMKNQMQAVLSMVGTLQKQELVFFSQAVPAMQALSRSGRRRVIAALQQVYG